MAALPYYYMLGQETAFRGTLSETWLTHNADDDLDDAESTIKIYNYNGTAVVGYNSTPSSALSNTQVSGELTTVAMDVAITRHLLTVHPSGFHILKRYAQGNVGNSGSNRWAKTYTEAYASFAAADTALRADITGGGDTVDVKGFFLSFGYVEAVTASGTLDAAFKTDLQQLILDLRADYAGVATPVVLDLPPKTVSGYSSSRLIALANARKVILQVAGEGTNISYIEADSEFRRTGDPPEYTGESTMSMGRRMAKEMERLVTGKGSVTGLGAPVYVMIGDDNLVGLCPFTFLEDGADEDYDGPVTNAKTWNWSNNTWETIDGTANSNTEGDGLTNFGPDISMMVSLLADDHPTGVYLFKLGMNTSSFGNPSSTGGSWALSDADIYSAIDTEWDLAKQAMLDVEDKIPDVRGLVIFQGQEDVATQALADAYAVNQASIIGDYRTLFKTRTDAADLPVVVVKMQNTGNYTAEYVSTVQSAQIAAGANDPAVQTLEIDTARVHSNDKNLSGAGTVDVGILIAAELGKIN